MAAIGSTPRTWRTLPSSDSSPITRLPSMQLGRHLPAGDQDAQGDGQVVGRAFLAHRAGARLTVTRLRGKNSPAFLMADCTRSRLSCTAASGRPTIVISGSPGCSRLRLRRPHHPGRSQRRNKLGQAWVKYTCNGQAALSQIALGKVFNAIHLKVDYFYGTTLHFCKVSLQ